MPLLIFKIAKMSRDLRCTRKGLNIVVKRLHAEDNPKGKTLKTKYLDLEISRICPVKTQENPKSVNIQMMMIRLNVESKKPKSLLEHDSWSAKPSYLNSNF